MDVYIKDNSFYVRGVNKKTDKLFVKKINKNVALYIDILDRCSIFNIKEFYPNIFSSLGIKNNTKTDAYYKYAYNKYIYNNTPVHCIIYHKGLMKTFDSLINTDDKNEAKELYKNLY
jgi:hypothetical protein